MKGASRRTIRPGATVILKVAQTPIFPPLFSSFFPLQLVCTVMPRSSSSSNYTMSDESRMKCEYLGFHTGRVANSCGLLILSANQSQPSSAPHTVQITSGNRSTLTSQPEQATDPSTPGNPALTLADLIAENIRLTAKNEALEKRASQLESNVRHLEGQVAAASHRQAAEERADWIARVEEAMEADASEEAQERKY